MWWVSQIRLTAVKLIYTNPPISRTNIPNDTPTHKSIPKKICQCSKCDLIGSRIQTTKQWIITTVIKRQRSKDPPPPVQKVVAEGEQMSNSLELRMRRVQSFQKYEFFSVGRAIFDLKISHILPSVVWRRRTCRTWDLIFVTSTRSSYDWKALPCSLSALLLNPLGVSVRLMWVIWSTTYGT